MPHQKDYPEAVFVPFISTAALSTLASINNLTTITRTTPGGSIMTHRLPRIFSNLDALGFYTSGDDTALDLTCTWIPEASGIVDKFFINIAVLMDMTAFTSNSATFQQVLIDISETGTGNQLIKPRVYPTGFAAAGADTIEQMFIVSEGVDNQHFRIQRGVGIDIRVRTVFAQTATNTVQFGIPELFPHSISDASKFLYESGIQFWITREDKEERSFHDTT